MHQMPSGELAQVGTYHCVRWIMPHFRINEIWPEISYSLSPNPPFLVIIFRPKSITKIFVPRYKVSSRDQKPVGAPLLETVRSTTVAGFPAKMDAFGCKIDFTDIQS